MILMRNKMEIKLPQKLNSVLDRLINLFCFESSNNPDRSLVVSFIQKPSNILVRDLAGGLFCCCLEALRRPSCLLNESPVIPLTLVCISARSNNKSQPAEEIWIRFPSPSHSVSPFSHFLSFQLFLLLSVWLRVSLFWRFLFCCSWLTGPCAI